jgi:hypothetical protein
MRRSAASALALVLVGSCTSSTPTPSGTPTVRKITAASELIAGKDAAGRVGDFLLDNGQARFLIQQPGSATGWGLYGGSLVDLDRSGGPGDDRLQEIFFQCDLRGFAPESATIVNDGADGQPAVLRLRGVDRGIPLLDAIIPSSEGMLDITVDLILPREGSTLEVAFNTVDLRRTELREIGCGAVLLHGDDFEFLTPGAGSAVAGGENDWIASSAPGLRASYVLFRKAGPLNAVLAIDEVVPLIGEAQPVVPGGRARDSFFIAVGDRDVESALAEVRRIRGETAPRVTVELPVVAPAPRLAHVAVMFRDRGRPAGADAVTRAFPDLTTGRARAALLPGLYAADVTLESRAIRTVEFEVTAGAAPTLAAVEVNDEGTLIVKSTLVDAAGRTLRPTGSHLFVKAGRDAAPNGPEVLKRYLHAEDRVVLPAGDYTVYVARGPECEYHKASITVPAGGEVTVEAKIAHVVDTTGWVTVDSHVHSTRSVDSNESMEQRALGAVGEGLEILLSTEHDVVVDYAPVVEKLGLVGQVATERGTEISPLYGHMNAWPLTAESPIKYWDLKWFQYEGATFVRMLDPHELAVLARERGAQIVQINHPRDSKGSFNYMQLDPVTGDSVKPWPNPDVVELINGKGEGGLPEVLVDLVNQWKKDRRVTAVGVSDAHGRGSEIGYARTAIQSASDDPATLELPAVWRALREGRAVVMSGPFVTLTARATAAGSTARAGVGEVLNAARAPVALDVRVQAPSWMDVSRVRVLADGQPLWSRTLTMADRDPANPVVRLSTTVTATPTQDAFYLVVVEGDGRNEPVMGSSAHGVTNPVFVDVAGDGYTWGR